ncbi:MAG: histidine kinase dimerization/phospho-acceptor domain-containing protein, partial [Algoriphagus sp.]
MIRFNQFDISDVFNEIQSPLLIFDSEEILFFNSYFKNNFKSISEVWREVVEDSELVKSLDGFFESGAVPMTTEIPQLKPKISDSYYYEWTFTNLPSSYSDRFLIVLGHGVKKVSENSNQKSIPKEGYLRSEEKYRTLVEESTEIIFSLSDTLNIDYISPNINQFVGYEAEAVIGTSIIDYLNPEDLDAFQSVVGDVNDFLAENQYLEFRIKHINGEYRVFGSNGRMVLERETNRRLYIGVARDITELKQIQKDLFHAKEKAEQASMAKSQFLSIMSHEIRTPMNAVIGLAHLLMDDNPRPDQMENLKTLQFSAENLMELINDILDFTKIESGKIELEQASLDLREIVNRIVHSYSFQAKEKGLFISTEIDGEIPHRLKGDSVRISQMLNNLLSNAIKFTAKGHVKVILKQVA